VQSNRTGYRALIGGTHLMDTQALHIGQFVGICFHAICMFSSV